MSSPNYFQNYSIPMMGSQMQSQYQPFDRLAQLQQNYTQMQQQYGMGQPQYPQNPFPQPNQQMLKGEIVDSIDVVRAKNVDMTGNPTYYPKSDGSEIYLKQLMPDGTSKTDVFRRVLPEEQNRSDNSQSVSFDAISGMIDGLRQELNGQLSEIKTMVSGTSGFLSESTGGVDR